MKQPYILILLTVSIFSACGLTMTPEVESKKLYQGEPGDFNGYYQGDVIAESGGTKTKGWVAMNINQGGGYIHSISIDIYSGTSKSNIQLSAHRIERNKLIDPIDNKEVGEIGKNEFFLERGVEGRVELTKINSTQAKLHLKQNYLGSSVVLDGELNH